MCSLVTGVQTCALPIGATLAYDPLVRLYQTVGGGTTTRFQYDGIDLIAEYNASNAVQRRYVHGPGVDNPIVWYEGSAISSSTRRFLMADERGSVVSVTDRAGATLHINAYDEYGIPAQTGRASCRERVWTHGQISGVAGHLKNTAKPMQTTDRRII